MENEAITRDQSSTLDKKSTNKKPWNPPTVKEFEIEKNTNLNPGGADDGIVSS